MEVFAATRPLAGQAVNGDAYLDHSAGGMRIVSIADGLGHGPEANLASAKAVGILKENCSKDLYALVDILQSGLKDTRGVAMSVMRFSLAERCMEYIGVGNVELHSTNRSISPISYSGILGHALRKAKVFKYPYDEGDVFALFSDGLSGRFSLDPADARSCEEMARDLLASHGKAHDDATVVVVRA